METVCHLASEKYNARAPAAWVIAILYHWAIEAKNHWRRDACAFEDKTRSKKTSVAATFAIVRCALLYFNSKTKSQNLNAFMEANAAKCTSAFALVMRSK
jgi:hypothetical protein